MDIDAYSGPRSREALAAGSEVKRVVIDHAIFRRIRDASMDLVDLMREISGFGGMLIQAEPGMGKSLLLTLIQKEVEERFARAGGKACLTLSLDNAVDVHSMAAAMTFALNFPALPSRPNLVAMNNMVNRGLESLRPAVMLIDEMQHVCEGNRDITARAVTDWLKVRMDAHNFPVICMGTMALERLAFINPQFTSRASANFLIPPFQFDDVWRQVLGGFTQAVKLVDLSIINCAACRQLHQVTSGNMRMLKRILIYGAMHAATQPNRIVSFESLSKGLRDTKGHIADQLDPFRVKK